MFSPVPVGKRTRYTYARIKEVMDMPHLLDIQRNSYEWFLKEGLQEIFQDISPIQDFTGNLVLSFEDFSLGEPKYALDECKERDVTLAAPLRVNVRLINRETGEIKEQEVFMGDFPLMTDTGTFIINGAERVIVSDVAGTTRDAIDTHFLAADTKFILIDTAGMRRKGKIDAPIERYSVMRSLRAIDRAGVVLMVINAAEGILEQDTKIAGYVHESGKGVIIVVNKWDIFPEKNDKSTLRFTDDLREKLGFLQYAPVLYTSALTGQRVERITELVKYVAEQQSMRIKTSVLNELIRDAVSVNPPPTKKGKQLKILFVTQVGIMPPTFIVFVNDPELMHFSYLRFIENRLRESFGFEGTPLRLVVRARKEEE